MTVWRPTPITPTVMRFEAAFWPKTEAGSNSGAVPQTKARRLSGIR